MYLLRLNKELWATVINDTDDVTTLYAMVHRSFDEGLHVYNEWKKKLYDNQEVS